jgi:hypothetical protein
MHACAQEEDWLSRGKAIMEGFDDPIIRIRPRRIVSWGLEDGFQARAVG